MKQYFAIVARGLETLVAQKLEQLGAHNVDPGFRGASFKGDRTTLYRVNLWARLPFRILVKAIALLVASISRHRFKGVKCDRARPRLQASHFKKPIVRFYYLLKQANLCQ